MMHWLLLIWRKQARAHANFQEVSQGCIAGAHELRAERRAQDSTLAAAQHGLGPRGDRKSVV